MPTGPTIAQRPDQPYVGITRTITMQTFGEIADRIPEIFAWLGSRGVQPAGAPFFRYHVIDMERELEVEAGVPVAAPVAGDGQVHAGVLPGGRYVTLTHVGHPDGLVDATAGLLAWAAEQGLEWDMTDLEQGQRWVSRLELFHTNPADEPDLNKWETELAFRLAD